MAAIEWRRMTPEETARDIETSNKFHRENKYAFQVGLKDLDFDIDEELLKLMGATVPFQSIDHAEQALRVGAIKPTLFIEEDDTEHHVLIFDHRPVGYSGFMNCVIHSLALTNLGLFEVGRYPAVNLSSQSRGWQWFLHSRLGTPEEIVDIQDTGNLSSEQFVEQVYQALTSF